MDEHEPKSRYLRLESEGGITVVHFVDIQISPDSKDELYGLVENDGHKRILINLSNISSMATFALGILANFQKKVHTAGGEMKLCSLNPDLLKMFHLMKFDRVFEIHANQDDAVRAF